MAGFILFTAGQMSWAMTNTKIQLQENLRRSLERVGSELAQSGRDSANALQVSILDNTGVNSTDILRFSIPICPCGVSVMDVNTEIKKWGAPLVWSQTGCQNTWTLNAQNNVDICHSGSQNIAVAPSSVNAYLSQGDWIGLCANCNPNSYTNRTIEYKLDVSNQLLRRVLDVNSNVLNSIIIAQDITNFQAAVNTQMVTLTMQLSKNAMPNKTVVLNGDLQVVLRNY